MWRSSGLERRRESRARNRYVLSAPLHSGPLTPHYAQITLVINSKKAAIEAARRRWLHKHRDLFIPLLPPSNHFFATLENELKVSTDKGSYKPLHELEKQPELIKGGQLKDYQVRPCAASSTRKAGSPVPTVISIPACSADPRKTHCECSPAFSPPCTITRAG